MMLAQHAPSHPPSPSFSHWPADKENSHPTRPSAGPSRAVLGSSSSSSSTSSAYLPRRKSPAFSTSSPYDRPAHPSSSSGQPKRRIKSVTNVTGPSSRTRGLRIPSLQAVASKIEKEAPLVEGEATPADGPVVFDRGSAFLPLSLPRPDRMAIIDIHAVEELEGIPYPYVMDRLMEQGPSLLQNSLAARLELPPTGSAHQALAPPLPECLNFHLNSPAYADPSSPFSLPPNYVLAVRPPPATPGAAPHVIHSRGALLPIHDLIYRSMCAHLPPIPSRSATLPASALPVIAITLPSPATLPVLNTFLYTQRPDILLSSLLNLPPLPQYATPKTRAELTAFMSQTMDLRALLERVGVVHQVWGNVCALGVADSLLWKALDTAWEVLVGSIAIVQARGGVPLPTPAIAPYPTQSIVIPSPPPTFMP